MDILAPLSTAVPLGGAAVLGGANRLLPRRLRDGLAFMVAATTTGLVLALMVTAARGPTVYWFSGWRPVHRVVIGVDYAFGSLGAGLAALAGLLACAALVYSSRFFETVGGLSHTLVLIFLAASADFCLTGDLFNLFVAFELVAVTGFVLTGYNANKTAPLQGAINFAVSNSLAGMVVLFGVALVYARTGALNLAQIGQYLAGRRADGVVVVAFALLIGGFLIKAAAVPFHFWVPDAYGAAPIPACVLFSGVMSELGLFAVARVWETAFSGLGGGAGHGLRFVLIGFGILTAVVGPLMALVQTHLKRMLAFLTMSHLGLYLIGFGLLSPLGLAGASLLAVGDGLAKAAMFFGVGALQKQRGSVNETKLRGLGASLPVLGVVVALGALVAPTCPPFVSATGKDLLVRAADVQGLGWIETVVAFCVIVSSGAVLRAAGRIWFGWALPGAHGGRAGERRRPRRRLRRRLRRADPGPDPDRHGGAPGGAPGRGPGSRPGPQRRPTSARRGVVVSDRAAYSAAVLHSHALAVGHGAARAISAAPATGAAQLLINLGEAAGAVGLGLLALARGRSAGAFRRGVLAATGRLRRRHSGHVGDQVTWLVVGLALLAGASALALG